MTSTEVRSVPAISLHLEQDEFEGMGIQPWFSYRANLPERPLPPISTRPSLQTRRLVVRSFGASDLQAFHELRQDEDIQAQSTFRGGIHKDLDTSKTALAQLQTPHDERHWYFGAFLNTTGELVGEGGILDSEYQPTSGWTRCEFLIKKKFQRQGYGTEFFKAVMDSWWDLPREWRRHQLLPVVARDAEPGDEVDECVEFVWEANNIAAQKFFAKMLNQAPVSAAGTFASFDWRDGHFGELGRWAATLATRPTTTT